jgi:hypothetical protein
MREYVDSHGEIPRGRSKAADDYPLGNWRGQLIACSKGKLSADRIARLEALPGWNVERILRRQVGEGFRRAAGV